MVKPKKKTKKHIAEQFEFGQRITELESRIQDLEWQRREEQRQREKLSPTPQFMQNDERNPEYWR